MSFVALAEAALQVTFDALGVDATYTPPGNLDPVPAGRVIVRRRDEILDIVSTRHVTETIEIEALAAALPDPVKGGKITETATGQAWLITQIPVQLDRCRLKWRIFVKPDEGTS